MIASPACSAAVIALRVKQPDKERPYRGPGAIHFRGHDLPLFAVVGGLGTGIAWVGEAWAGIVPVVGAWDGAGTASQVAARAASVTARA